jgi:prepilin-type N-terminal cleavage/methylation domain-containing protein
MKFRLDSSTGFTLIELLLSMTIFSAVMVIATVGFIGMNRTFSRGVISKELLDYSQATTEDVTSVIRNIGKSLSISSCMAGDTECPTASVNEICLGNERYVWSAAPDGSGLYRDSSACGGGAIAADARVVMGDRYVVRSFNVKPVESADATLGVPVGLYKVSGVFSTADNEALFFGDPPGVNPDQIRCLGTTESVAVRTCAVEKFNFVINPRGE